METQIEIIREMLLNIRTCPNTKCASCNLSVEIAEKALEVINRHENSTSSFIGSDES